MSSIKGVRSTRRLMKRLPDALRQELAEEMRGAGAQLSSAMKARAPVGKTGALQRGLNFRFYPASMRLRVGLIGKPLNRRLFYGWILNYGRKAKAARATRVTKSGALSTYTVNVRAMAPRRFVTGPLTDLRATFNRRLKGIWDRAIAKVAAGND